MMRRISIAASVALAAVPALLACNRTAAEEQPGSEWAVVERRDMQVRAEAAGAIEPIRLVEVKSKASGEVVRLHVESGDEVERGALLVEIDPRDVRNGFNQAEADLAVAEASLSTAVAQTARVKEL
ncbi:MAG: biotin/lipoyl-binding protein, partial [Longimicrobiales bacterium]